MKKKLLSLFTAALMAASLLVVMPVMSVGAEKTTYTSGDWEYSILDEGISITASTAKGDVVIPESIDGYTVVELGDKLFYGKSGITSVTIPSTLTNIGMWSYIFSYCYDLEGIIVDENNSGLCSVDGVLYSKDKSILYNYPCAKSDVLAHVPDTVEYICCTAFARAIYLEELFLDSANTAWFTYTFWGDSDLTVYYLTGGQSEKCIQSGDSYPTFTATNCSHVYSDWTVTKEATATTAGEKQRTCSVCGYKETQEIPATGAEDEITIPAKINTPEGMTISKITVEMKSETSDETVTVTIADGKITIESVSDGTYTLTFSAENCAPRSYTATVENGAIVEDIDVSLNLYGDVNGDGSLDIKDMSLVYKHINETKLLTDEQVKIADVNGDDSVDIKDYSKIYKHVNETALLW